MINDGPIFVRRLYQKLLHFKFHFYDLYIKMLILLI